MDELESMREIYDFPPELDFCSDSFDPECALNSYIHLPFPNAKTYNNLAEYYSHTFLKKDDRKKVEKDRPYDRDYSFYYATLGLDFRARERFERRRLNKIKNMKYAGWRSAKLKKKLPRLDDDPNREPCRSYPPLQSTKIIQLETALSKRKIYTINNPTDNSEMNLDKQLNEFMESETKEDQKYINRQNKKKLSEIGVTKSDQDMCPQTSNSSGVGRFVSKKSEHHQRIYENPYKYEKRYEHRYWQRPNSDRRRQSRDSHFRKDSQTDIYDPRLRRNKRYP